MKRLLIMVALLLSGTAAAQKTPDAAPSLEKERGRRDAGVQAAHYADAVRTPDETDILARTLASDSPYFYPQMMMRYMGGDETLTPDHYYYLYYGYAYDASYDAHKALPGTAVMAEVLGGLGPGGTPSEEEAREIIAAGRQNMMIDPFSPSNLNLMTWAYGLVGDSVNMRLSAARFAGVVGAISRSGTGARERSPWHILRFEHAADIVAARGLTVEKSTVRTRDVEYVQVARNSQGVKGFFFDFSRVYLKPFEGERVKREHRWELNGTPI